MPASDRNLYGDKLAGGTARGVDIASQRIDDLDLACLRHAATLPPMTAAADLGCGEGAQGFRLAVLGLHAILVDVVDIGDRCKQLKSLLPSVSIKFVHGDLRDVPTWAKDPLGIIYSQRTLHYLRFADAVDLLREARKRLLPAGKFYLSFSGLGSELGDGYEARTREVADRWSKLSAPMAERHQIRDPVCLYSEDDVRLLAKQAGLAVEGLWSSPFGNVKAILRPG